MTRMLAPVLAREWERGALGLIGLVLLYAVTLDQGLLFSLIQGATAFDQNMLHEIVHDARHLAALPCH